MKFMTMVKAAETQGPPPQELMEAIYELGQKEAKNGTLVLTGGLGASAASARVKVADGEITVHDGPFIESKELVGGFAIFEVDSKEEAVKRAVAFMQLHRKHWPGWEGETEVRPIDTLPEA
jgi:hypothetical protein